jgi:hypothetical protein
MDIPQVILLYYSAFDFYFIFL